MRLPFALNSYRSRNLPVSAQRVINWHAEAEPRDAKSPLILLPTPGLSRFATLPTGPVRGMQVMGAFLYVVSGTGVYAVDVRGAVAFLGNIADGGPVTMANNGMQMAIVTQETQQGWVATSSAVTQITDTDFGNAVSVTALDGFGVFVRADSTQFFISALNDMTAFDALDFASAEGDPDNLVVARRVGRELWLFGERTTEIWANTGAQAFPFQRISGAFVERGCAARNSVTQRLGVPFWLGDDRVVYRGQGAQPDRISTHAIEQAIAGYAIVSDAVGWIYEQEGHTFYVLSFPDAGATWVYDMATSVWHERESEGYDTWRASHGASFGGQTIVGDARDGRLYVVDPTARTEDGDAIIRTATSAPLNHGVRRVSFSRVTLDMETGTGLPAGQGSDPQVWLSWSNDGGRTYGDPVTRSLGAMGQYRQRVRFDRLGSGRDRVFRVQMSDPVQTALMALDVDADEMAA